MRSLLLLVLVTLLPCAHAAAQLREYVGTPGTFEFSRTHGWVLRARAVAEARRADRYAARDGALAAAVAPGEALSGELDLPAFLVLYRWTDSVSAAAAAPRDVMARRIFNPDPAPPYSVTTYYDEVSAGRFQVRGTVFDWTRVSRGDSYYEGGPFCNGVCAGARIWELIREIVAAHDGTVDFASFDNDGPDGVPNSGDDDGYVDAIVLFHPELDGACGNDNIWAHRWTYAAWTGEDLVTDDSAAAGGTVRIRDYVIQGGQGGDDGCTAGRPQAMGLVAHEIGHLLGLPDLYDTRRRTWGVGDWGLMGTGNLQIPTRPAALSAWSLAELGWIDEVVINRDTLLTLVPLATGRTAYTVPLPASSEYFVLANRQPIGADSALHGTGLLIWHADPDVVARERETNTVNAVMPPGVALEEADGFAHLANRSNRGDAGDPFPGSAGNAGFDDASDPAARTNGGRTSGVGIHEIAEAGDGRVTARVTFLHLTVLASDTIARVRVNGAPYRVFQAATAAGDAFAIGVDSVQGFANGGSRWVWRSWSHLAPREHRFVASDTVTALVAGGGREHRLRIALRGDGHVRLAEGGRPVSETFVAESTWVTLAAEPAPGSVFHAWSGDRRGGTDTLSVLMVRPTDLTAEFAPRLVALPTPPATAVLDQRYLDTLRHAGGAVPPIWEIVGGDTLPPGISMSMTGVLSGSAWRLGTFPFRVRALSAAQVDTALVTFRVEAPALVPERIVPHLAGAHTLEPEEIRFLDRLGNNNGRLDVGDFLAWWAAGRPLLADSLRLPPARRRP